MFKVRKKFFAIVWVYPEYVQKFLKENNYVLHIFDIANKKGYQCEMFLINAPDSLSCPDYIQIYYYKGFLHYLKYLWSNRDCVAYVNSFVWQSLISGLILKKATIMPHGYALPNDLWKRILVAFFYRFFEKIRVTNRNEGDSLIRTLKIPQHKIWVCPLVVHDIYKNKNYNAGPVIKLLTASVLKPVKDPITILCAVKILVDKGVDVHLTMAGSDLMGIDKKIQEFDLRHHVTLFGEYLQKDLPELFEKSDMFIYSSIGEGQCLGVYEASLAGLPLCLSRIPAFLDVFRDSALFHRVGDADELADNIIRYSSSREFVENAINRNRNYVLEKCSYKNISENIEKNFFNNSI